MNNFFEAFMDKIDITIVVIVLLSGFFQARYIKFKVAKDPSYNSAIMTLLLSAVVSIFYIWLIKNPNNATNWAKYFMSYFAATSLYELLISKLVDFVNKKTGADIKQP